MTTEENILETLKLNARLERIEIMLAELLSQKSMPVKDVMNTIEVARYLGVTPGHIRKLVSNGDIPHYKAATSNRNFFKRTDIDNWRTANRCKTNMELKIEAATKSATSSHN